MTSRLRNQNRKQQRNVNRLRGALLHPQHGRHSRHISNGQAIRSNGGGDVHQWFLANIAVSLVTIGFWYFVHWGVALAFWLLASLMLMLIRPD